uniref:Uncharacterized protein n=1 Tax=Anopheles culicifacies TaxID=139723 RepID=A0A182MSB0_9DIPT
MQPSGESSEESSSRASASSSSPSAISLSSSTVEAVTFGSTGFRALSSVVAPAVLRTSGAERIRELVCCSKVFEEEVHQDMRHGADVIEYELTLLRQVTCTR